MLKVQDFQWDVVKEVRHSLQMIVPRQQLSQTQAVEQPVEAPEDTLGNQIRTRTRSGKNAENPQK